MKDIILEVLKENGIENYLIQLLEEESSELFFIKKNLDMKRAKKVNLATVTVYRDFQKDGKDCRGNANCTINPSDTREEIKDKLQKAYLAASFVPNEVYQIAPEAKCETIIMESDMSSISLGEAALILTRALYQEDHDEQAFINSAEIFVTRNTRHILNSNGVDVSYVKYKADGEFVTQCKDPEDVETHNTFAFDNLECEELARRVKNALQVTKDRAIAKEMPKSGTYNVILSEKSVATIMRYYEERADGYYIYQQYSDYKVADSVQGDQKEIQGERLNMSYLPTTPYSMEGVEMKELPFIKDGVLENIHGACRFLDYLKVKPVGSYTKFYCKPGEVSFEEMKKQPGLHVVTFSDFQMDSFSGHFGGEIRLAYLNDGETIKPVTGGSINGSIFDVQKDYVFTKETQSDSAFVGPYAVLLKNVSVAGA